MIEMRYEMFDAPIYDWHHVPFTENHHKWWLQWYRIGDNGEFFFSFVSPKGRRYSFYTALGENGGRVTSADIAGADNGARIASYYEDWGDSPARLDAVIRLTPKHVMDRLFVLLDAIG